MSRIVAGLALFGYLLSPASILGLTNPSSTILTASQMQVSTGELVILTATVAVNGQPSDGGQVRFLEGKRDLGSVQIVVSGSALGTATLRTRSLRVGANSISALFSGAPGGEQASAPSQSSPIVVTVPASPIPVGAMTLVGSSSGSAYLQAIVTGSLAAPTGAVTFVDATTGSELGSAQLDATAGSSQVPAGTLTSYTVGSNPVATCVGDFNQDGTLDLAVVNYDGLSLSVLFGDPNNPGHFLPQVVYNLPKNPVAVVSGDFNADGLLDLATANSDGSVSILFGFPGQAGQFQPPVTFQTGNTSSILLRVDDFNRDGLLDLAAIGAQTVVLLNSPQSPGTFVAGTPGNPSGAVAAASADFNGDGYPDLVAATQNSLEVYYAIPANPGQFEAADAALLSLTPPPAPLTSDQVLSAVAVADFNGDGVPDIAVAATIAAGTVTFGNSQTSAGFVDVFLGSASQPGTFTGPAEYSTGGVTALAATGANSAGNVDLLTIETEYTSMQTGMGDITVYEPVASWVGLLAAGPNINGPFVPDSEVEGTSLEEGPYSALVTGDFTGEAPPISPSL